MCTPFQLIDLSQIEDNVLSQHPWAGLMELLMKHINEQDTLHLLKKLLPLLQNIQNAPHGIDYIEVFFHYWINTGDTLEPEKLIEALHAGLSEPTGEKTMTIAERLIEKGILKGREEGIQAIAIKLLTEGTEPLFVAKITDLSIDEIKALQAQIHH